MKNKASNKRPTPSKRVLSWDDAVFDPADLVRDVKDLADHYAGKRKLTLRTYTVVAPAPKFTPAEIELAATTKPTDALLDLVEHPWQQP